MKETSDIFREIKISRKIYLKGEKSMIIINKNGKKNSL